MTDGPSMRDRVRQVMIDDLPMQVFETLADEIYEVNVANGWFSPDEDERTVMEGHMLLVTEVAEASEAYRMYGLEDSYSVDNNGHHKPEGVGSEYADVLIRLLDQCRRDGINLLEQVRFKLNYNETRGYRHGGKKK